MKRILSEEEVKQYNFKFLRFVDENIKICSYMYSENYYKLIVKQRGYGSFKDTYFITHHTKDSLKDYS